MTHNVVWCFRGSGVLGSSNWDSIVFLYLFALLGSVANTTAGAVFSQAINSLSIKELDGTNKASTGATVALVAARVAIVHMGADKTLLVAQQDHDL